MLDKILYYTDCNIVGGAEQYLLTVFEKIDRNKWQIVLAYHPSDEISSFLNRVRELNIETVPVPKVRGYMVVYDIWKFTKIVRSIGPSIFHANLNWPLSCTYGIIAAYLSRVKIIVATQHLYSDIGSRLSNLVQRIVSRLVNRYVSVSSHIATSMKEHISPGTKIKVIHNGIIIQKFSGLNSKRGDRNAYSGLIPKQNSPIILTVARLHKQKGHKYLLEASKMFDNANFVFAGDGPERDNLEAYAREIQVDDRIKFLGHREDIPTLINGCDLFVLPSLFEGLPLTIMEAMAAGKPVIASDIPGIDDEVIQDETGLLVPKESPEALGEAIKSLLSNPEYAKRLGSAGRIRANEEFSAETMIIRLEDLYEELIKTGIKY